MGHNQPNNFMRQYHCGRVEGWLTPSPAKAGAGIGRRVERYDSRGNAVNCGTTNVNREQGLANRPKRLSAARTLKQKTQPYESFISARLPAWPIVGRS